MLINLLILTASIVYIWNHSGFIYDMTKMIFKKLNPDKQYVGQMLPKPFSCFTCMTFWIIFIYSLFTYALIYSLGLAVLFSIIALLIDKLFYILFKIIHKIK